MKHRNKLTGFRNASCMVEVIKVHPHMYLTLLLILIVVLNYYDIMHTIHLCSSTNIIEGNPFIRFLLQISPRLAIVFKMGVTILFAFTMLLYSTKHFMRTFIISSLIAFVYLVLTAWHVSFSL